MHTTSDNDDVIDPPAAEPRAGSGDRLVEEAGDAVDRSGGPLPSMADLDLVAADLDQIDADLAGLDQRRT